jgi:DNA primase
MALPPAFLDELRARTPLSALVGRRVKLSKSGRNWKGCCPFHGEKSPSFHVYDDHFHCFGCGAHGDAISFVMQNEGASFPEAVERLAGEAGLEVPKPSPRAVEAERQRLDLHGVLDLAQASFARRLQEREGAAALDYLRGRGLSEATIAQFGLGWSGEGRGALMAELARAGVEPARMLEAGLLREAEDGPPRELYWNRVTFPIRDRRGRLISFGGRTLGDAKPKYINGPESPVFSKKRNLYALDLARAGLRAGQRLIVAEGYMDVIALHQAGFAGAVAPLGTALTEEQLEELWRLAPDPVLCFDGDAAGARAAARAAELCLPLLTPERSLRLAALPGGDDPDTLIRKQGKTAFQSVIDAARPLSEALYDIVREQGGGDTPEQRAALRARLVAAAGRIADRSLAAEYRSALLDRFYASRKQSGGKRGGKATPAARTARSAATPDLTQTERGRCLVAILLRHPDLLRDTEEAFVALELSPAMSRLRDAILHASERKTLDSAALLTQLNASGAMEEVAQALSSMPYPLPACAHADAMPAEAEAGWWHIFGLMHRSRLEEEVAAAGQAFIDRPDEAAQRRLIALCAARDALSVPDQDAEAEP